MEVVFHKLCRTTQTVSEWAIGHAVGSSEFHRVWPLQQNFVVHFSMFWSKALHTKYNCWCC